MRLGMLAGLALLALPAPTVSSAEEADFVRVEAYQTTYLALCQYCVGATVNQTTPLVVREASWGDTLSYLSFDIPEAPPGMELESALLVLHEWQQDGEPSWMPRVSVNYTDSDLDLVGLVWPWAPLPETPPSLWLGEISPGTESWEVTGFVRPLLGAPLLFILYPAEGAQDDTRFRFEGNWPDGDRARRPTLQVSFRPETPVQQGTVSRTKSQFVDPDRELSQ